MIKDEFRQIRSEPRAVPFGVYILIFKFDDLWHLTVNLSKCYPAIDNDMDYIKIKYAKDALHRIYNKCYI